MPNILHRCAYQIAPSIFSHYQVLMRDAPVLSPKNQLANLGRDVIGGLKKLTGISNTSRKQYTLIQQSDRLNHDFSSHLLQEKQEIKHHSMLKAVEYTMLAKYSLYLEEINSLTESANQEKIYQSTRKIQKNQKRLSLLQLKLASCSPENLEKIKAGLKKNKNYAHYYQTAVEYVIDANCQHILSHEEKKLSEKEQRKILYQRVRQDWMHSARCAYWPRLLGGSTHITGSILTLTALILKETPMGAAGHFLMGFSRIFSDSVMGSTRLSFKAFEELMNQYLFFKPAGILEQEMSIEDALHSFRKNLAKINAHQHPNLSKVISIKNHRNQIIDFDINTLKNIKEKMNDDESALVQELKNSLHNLRGARHREKIESSGSAAQLRNNLGLGLAQLTLNVLKFIPSLILQISLSVAGVLLAIAQHTLNYFMAPADFCRKMEQNCVSQLNMSHGNAEAKTQFQAQMHALKKQQKENIEDVENINQKAHSLLTQHKEQFKDVFNSTIKPLHYRLKNLRDAQDQVILKTKSEIINLKDNQEKLLEHLKNTFSNKQNISTIDILQYVQQFHIEQKLEHIKDEKQKFLVQTILKIEQKIQAKNDKIKNMNDDADCLIAIQNAQTDTEIEKNIEKINNPKLKKAIEDGTFATQYIIASKKTAKGERFRYLFSYLAPSLLTGAILMPLLVSAAVLPNSNPDKAILKTSNGLLVNIIAAIQQLTTGSNNAKRDEFKKEICQDAHKGLSVQTAENNQIVDTRCQNNPPNEVQKKYKKISLRFMMKCALAPLTAIAYHKKAADAIEEYGIIFEYL